MKTRTFAGRIFLFLVVLLALFAGLEIGLRLKSKMSAYFRKPVPKGSAVVLCIGDSFVSGFGAPKGFSFPDYLKTLFEQRGIDLQVVNAGITGQNSAELLAVLPTEIGRFPPGIVILQTGLDNFIDHSGYGAYVARISAPVQKRTNATTLFEHSLVFKLFFGRTDQEMDLLMKDKKKMPKSQGETLAWAASDIREIVRMLKGRGFEIIVNGYPLSPVLSKNTGEYLAELNKVLAKISGDEGAAFIDEAKSIRDLGQEDIGSFFNVSAEGAGHCNAWGYRVMAVNILNKVKESAFFIKNTDNAKKGKNHGIFTNEISGEGEFFYNSTLK